MKTLRLGAANTALAAEILRGGGLVGIPTETVYGLGANALDEEAVRRIFEAKGRPQDNPLIIHVPSAAWLERYCTNIPEAAYALAAEFWPGPLTMILPRREIVPLRTTGGLETVGVRCPNHPLTLAIIEAAGVPIAAPSGNTSGRPSPTTAEHMWEDMDGKIDAIVEGGACQVGVESTIIDLTAAPPQLLRAGGLPLEELRRVLGDVTVDAAVTRQMAAGERPRAPGMKYRHYAPRAPVTVFTGNHRAAALAMAARAAPGTGIICFDEDAACFPGCEIQTLGAYDAPAQHARRVFDALRHFDRTDVAEILAQCPPETGLGLAVANRLKKAAGFQTVAVPGTPMPVLGITGGTGCGKTTLLRQVEAHGGLALDCDEVYHALLQTDAALLMRLRARFPAAFAAGALDRKALGRQVFGDPAALAELNAITHPAVRTEVARRLAQAQADGYPLAAVDAVGLIEGGLAPLCSRTVAVTAPTAHRVARLMAREGIGEDYARLRIAAQKPDAAFAAQCDDELVNDCPDAAAFAARCEAYLNQLFYSKEESENMSEKKYEEQRKALLASPKNGYDRIEEATRGKIMDYAEPYKRFLNVAKTEREAVAETIRMAEAAGFHAWQRGEALKAGDRVYYNNRGKAIMLAVVGQKDLSHGAHICAAHIDNPRLDLKPNPLYEESEMAFFKTHYYGGIKKYQWTTVPLALHGIVVKKDGSVVTVCIGEDESDPVLVINDLLIHLSGDQMKKPLAEGISGEQLNVLLGTMPLPEDEGGDRVKFAVMMLLHERYGITEEDFLCAELTMVPAQKARDVGLDRSLIGAFGHDDRVCAYAALEPMLRVGVPEITAVCVLADKEEIGSVGVSGMQSEAFETFMEGLCDAQGVNLRVCFEKSMCLSTDVSNAFEPSFPEVHDRRNNTRINYGLGLCKYTGSRGKSGASDAAAELVGRVRALFDANGVLWQMGELGRVDAGGGGTVAAYMANRNIDTIDAGVPVLSMHAPFEVISKLDLYMAARANEAFYNAAE